ncbi:MAG: hypothetical protein QNJ75_07610 [Acidimicrobiia bacterium]|nr:hypothetical protein [Acidimicrobiia bacterium]
MNDHVLDNQIKRALTQAAAEVPVRDRLAEFASVSIPPIRRRQPLAARPLLVGAVAFVTGLVLVGGALAILRSATDNPAATSPPATEVPITAAPTTSLASTTTSPVTTTSTTTSTDAPRGPILEIRTPAGLPGAPLVICGDARESTTVRVVLSDPLSGDSWPDEIDEFVETDASGRWCWQGIFPDLLQINDLSPTPNFRPIEAGTYEIRLESFGNILGYDTVEVLPGYSTDDGASQSAADAKRDGVVGSVAELSIADRVRALVWADSEEGLWVLSRTDRSEEMVLAGACEPEDPGCVYGRDYAFVPEYAELLLMDPTGAEILRAFPMPGLVPSWLVVGHDAVYTGRIGDGGLPDSSVVRVVRETFELAGMVFAAELDGPSQVVTAIREGNWLAGWLVYEGPELDRSVVTMDGNTVAGVKAQSWIGEVWVDPDGIDSLLGFG